MEIEAMQAVFMDDFECFLIVFYLSLVVSNNPTTYRIKIYPSLGGENYGFLLLLNFLHSFCFYGCALSS